MNYLESCHALIEIQNFFLKMAITGCGDTSTIENEVILSVGRQKQERKNQENVKPDHYLICLKLSYLPYGGNLAHYFEYCHHF